LREVAGNVSSALDFFSGHFGPPALKTLTIAPIPGTFGEGFPGLVYLSTLSYLNPSDLPQALRSRQHQLFFTDLIEAHEVAHQWWGNVVTTNSYQDEWLLEALSNYSALLWIEKKKGTKAMESALDDYRDHLLSKDAHERTIESAGPIVLGSRLDTAGIFDAWRSITYEKGAWIMHMLRRRLGDERFLKMLAELRRRYEFRAVSTDDFRALVKEFRPPRTSVTLIDEFFDNWVYSSGVPSLDLRYSAKGAAPSVKLSGTIAQSGVDDEFSVEVPLEIRFAKGAPQVIWVRTSNEGVPFTATLRQAPVRVAVATSSVLATKK
jgi:aminopeptidase N